MFETIAVLVVFFFLLIFGVSFYFVMQRSSFNRQVERNAQLNSVELSQKISDIPELDCALAGIQIENCVDRLKLEILYEQMQQDAGRIKYFGILGYSKIDVDTIYPEFKKYELYEREPETFTSSYRNNIPTLLYDPIENKFSFAILEITTYMGG